jgi:PAS domain S-box-containing protein
LRPDGTIVWANSRLTRLDDEQGRPRSVLAVTVDLSDRLQAEEALREREQRLSIATEAAQLGIFEWKVPEDITIWENDRQYELFGLTPADGPVSAQEFFLNYLHPGDTEALTAKLTEAMQTGILLQTSYRICRKDGTTRWIEVNGQFEFAADGSPLRFVGVNADITDRKQAEAIITTDLENTRLLRDLSARLITEDNIQVLYDEIVSAAITLTQADAGSIQALDESTQELVLLATQGIDRTVTDHCQRVTASSVTSCGVVLATGKRAFVDFDVPESEDPDGSLRLHVNAGLICAQSTPMVSRSGRRIGMVSTHWCKHHRPSERELRFLDLLVRQAADLIEQRQTAAEREQLLAREQAAREEADLANRMKDEFLAVLSHELRSPLNPILGWSRLLQKGKLDEAKIAQALATIERNAKLQAELIEDLLDVSRILRGKLSLNVSPVNLASIIKAALETVRLAAEAKSITVEVNLAPNVKPVSGDTTRLQQVVWNLLSNAVKFTPTGGRVTVRLEQVDTHAQITVSDNGKGIPSAFLPYVFDYFRQADSATTRKFGGLGLGLAIVRHLVELHGGTVQADSLGEGQGATFIVELPLMPISAAENQQQQFPQSSLNLQGIRVLVVDDDT